MWTTLITKRGIRIWSPIQVLMTPNVAWLCWADDTCCCPCSDIVTLSWTHFFLISKMRKGIDKKYLILHGSQSRERKIRGIRKWELLLGLTLLSGRNMLLCLWYSNSTLNVFFKCDFLPMITVHQGNRILAPWMSLGKTAHMLSAKMAGIVGN